MLRQKTSYSSHTSPEQSPSPSPIPGSRSSSSASNHHYHHHSLFHETTSASGVRRAFTQLQNALHPSRNNQQHQHFPTETRHTNGMPVQSDLGGYHYNYNRSNGNGAISNDRLRPQYNNKFNGDLSPASALAQSTYSAHSNGTTDSFYSSSSTMSPLTTDDDNSSITSQSRPQRPRPMSKASSLPSPLGTYSHGNGSTEYNPAQSTRQGSIERLKQSSVPLPSNGSNKSGTESRTKVPLQLRVRNFERSAANTGYLTKFSSRTFFSRKQWKRRYFVLTHKSLHCFKSADPQHPLMESLPLTAETIVCVTDIFSGKRYCLQITSPNEKEWFVLADTAAEMAVWLRALKGTVLQYRNRQIDSSRPPGDELAAADILRPYSPALTSDSTSIVPRSSSPPPRPPHPSQFYADLYPSPSSMTNPSLSPPPRATVSKPPTPIPGSRPQGYEQEQTQGTRRRTNSTTIASAHATADYASFSTVMERADVPSYDERHRSTLSSNADTTHVYGRRSSIIDMYDDHDGNYSYDHDVSARRSGSTGHGSVSGGSLYSRRTSITSDRPDSGTATLPRRSSQRMVGSPSRPLSPVSRPLSPSQMSRSSPRNSLVIAPPPRSVHRPMSVSLRSSTQVTPSHSGSAAASPHARPLSPTPENNVDGSEGALSRITSIRHNRDFPVRQRHVSLGNPGESAASFRSPSRSSTMPGYMTSQPDRPLSPAPTLPLPDVPSQGKPESSSPNGRGGLTHQLSNGSGRRIQIVPRHHDPEILTAHRPSNPKPRVRCQSQESALMSMAHDTQFSIRTNGTTTPSPRLGAVATQSVSKSGQDSAPASPSTNPHRTSLLMSKHISLPLNSRLVLPAPPSTQQPDIPVVAAATSTSSALSISSTNSATTSPNSSRPTSTHQPHHHHHPPNHRHSTSTSSLSSQSSLGSFAAGITTASLGGPVPRKNHNSTRDSSLSSRLSSLAPLPPGAASSVPSPPTSALPPIPGSVAAMEVVKTAEILVEEEEEEVEENQVGDVAAMIPLPPSPSPSDGAQTLKEDDQVKTPETPDQQPASETKSATAAVKDEEFVQEPEQKVMEFELVLEEQVDSAQDSVEMLAVQDTETEKISAMKTLDVGSEASEKEKKDIFESQPTQVVDTVA
ncbi:hypothetical protein EMPS_01344 [Entomortierella parvispora]|uniref:PH domain-containing protein n=1 Tax=Entomortierella parvispora TaxID=205924 RepID=A0A9P3H3E2_9FUNG|nr:hypothetical protein EMPS_01344 [Entomortierella parvispora]